MARYENLNVTNLAAAGNITVTGNLTATKGSRSPNYEFVDGGRFTTAGGDTTETITRRNSATANDLVLAGYSTTNDTDNQNPLSIIQTNHNTITAVMAVDPSTAHAIDWLVVRDRGVPALQVVTAGNFTTAGGDATETITATGALAMDLCLVQVKTKGSTPRVVCAAVTAANAITVTMDDDPSTDHVLSYVVLRPTGNFTPSHYIAFAGNHTSVGGSAAEAITVTGLKSTDIAFACYNTTNDTDLIVTVAPTTNTLTVTCSADPSTAHKFSYFALRAY